MPRGHIHCMPYPYCPSHCLNKPAIKRFCAGEYIWPPGAEYQLCLSRFCPFCCVGQLRSQHCCRIEELCSAQILDIYAMNESYNIKPAPQRHIEMKSCLCQVVAGSTAFCLCVWPYWHEFSPANRSRMCRSLFMSRAFAVSLFPRHSKSEQVSPASAQSCLFFKQVDDIISCSYHICANFC